MAKRQDALDFLDEITAWSALDMQRMVQKMMTGAENVMGAINKATAGDIDSDRARMVKDLSTSLRSIADSIERYTGIYQWCIQAGQTGNSTTALEDLLPLLELDEQRVLHDWMRRLEAYHVRG